MPRPGEGVVGREAELEAIAQLLDPAAAGPQPDDAGRRVLVLEGEAGIGKTTLWREGKKLAVGRGFRVLSCRGSPTETTLSFAALADLLAPVEPDAYEALPGPQRRALDAALLRADTDERAPDPRAIGTAVVSVLGALASDTPVLLALDDVQWLDPPSTRALAFALRRLDSEPVAALGTRRLDEQPSPDRLFSEVPPERIRRLRLGPLSRGALYQVLSARLDKSPARPLLGRIEAASGGNPFYALEIARALEIDGPPAFGEALPVPDDLRDLLLGRLRRLPEPTRDELLRLSALAQPTAALIDLRLLEPAEEAGVAVVRNDGRVEFAHPLFANAVYTDAPHERLRKLHEELAERVSDIEERARHLSLAATGPDPGVAAALDEAADQARRRGAPDVAAELAEQAAERTPAGNVELRNERLLRAAGHHLKAGDRDRAEALGKHVAAAPVAPPIRVRALHLLAEAAMQEPPAARSLLEDALGHAIDDAGLEAQLETSLGLVFSAQFDPENALLHLGRAVELAEVAEDDALVAEATALRTLANFVFGGGLDEEELDRALALEDHDRDLRFQLRPSFNAAQAYMFVGRIDEARALLVGLRERILARGDENDLAWVLGQLAAAHWLAGEPDAADRTADEALDAAELANQELFRALALISRAMARATRGDGTASRVDADEALSISERAGWPHGVAEARWAQAFASLCDGDAAAAVATLEPVLEGVEAFGVYEWPLAMSVPDAIEALVLTGDLERADRLTNALGEWGRRFDRPWALALSGRSRALVAAATGDLESAQAAAAHALVEHQRLGFPFELARTQLVLGQIQRRRRHERDARTSLRAALATFEQIGAPAWAARAEAELARVPVRRVAAEDLTSTEERVAELAAAGHTNREVAGLLFISPKTVEAHLTRAYRKLGVHSRAELGARMAERRREAEQAKT
jgi:DNA-binding CsgD family transcriptional regulator